MAEDPEDLITEDDESIDEEAVPMSYDIATYPSDYTLSGINEMWNNGDIVIPEFQREFVWTIQQSSLLIDSFLCGLPVPSVFFYIDEENKNLVIDGQQRILSVVFFMEGYFGRESTHGKRSVFRLRGIGDKNPYVNKRFVDLDEADQRKLKQTVLRAVNIRQLSPQGEGTSAYHIFERLNTGGTPLRPQEIRNVVFRGELTKILKRLNRDENWRKILGRKSIDRRQRDVEFLLRVFALVGSADKYEKPMKEFLNKAMSTNRKGRTQKAIDFQSIFPKVTKLIVEQMGERPFHIRGPINIAALDSITAILIENYAKLPKHGLEGKRQRLLKSNDFEAWTRPGSSDAKVLQDRFALVRKVFMEK
ncbi:DUF262 domain-containing protein [Tunturibacter empetritectus]|uniref:GmrSD restriction endonucleases N-terminal domain-containing protein n=1 Tax=Tunturiibacter empetritectus TaxID=3069691 RepID=A0A7W8MQ23_9BACT|nr:DUF262 domain-containing protein [Edaphobacter lichenicola]MBB5315822.1 hypothetical protein [Edaphobacter lichenicola]